MKGFRTSNICCTPYRKSITPSTSSTYSMIVHVNFCLCIDFVLFLPFFGHRTEIPVACIKINNTICFNFFIYVHGAHLCVFSYFLSCLAKYLFDLCWLFARIPILAYIFAFTAGFLIRNVPYIRINFKVKVFTVHHIRVSVVWKTRFYDQINDRNRLIKFGLRQIESYLYARFVFKEMWKSNSFRRHFKKGKWKT